VAKARPRAWASAANRVLPTTPRMSYSRRMLGSKRCDIGKSRSEIGFHQLAQRVAEFRWLQTERWVGFEIAEILAATVAARRCAQPIKGLAVADQFVETVGQLDLAAGAGSGVTEMAEDLRLDDIAADDHQRRGRDGRLRFLDDPFGADQLAVVLDDVEDAVAPGLLARDLHDRDHVPAGPRMRLDHLGETRRVAYHQIVGQKNGERLVGDPI